MTTNLEDLLDLENQGWQSLCEGTGADFYGTLMTGCFGLSNRFCSSRW